MAPQPEPKDWTGTIFSVLIAGAAIATSCLMPAMGVFWSAISQSLMAKGIGDLLKAAVAVITNNPIDLNA